MLWQVKCDFRFSMACGYLAYNLLASFITVRRRSRRSRTAGTRRPTRGLDLMAEYIRDKHVTMSRASTALDDLPLVGRALKGSRFPS